MEASTTRSRPRNFPVALTEIQITLGGPLSLAGIVSVALPTIKRMVRAQKNRKYYRARSAALSRNFYVLEWENLCTLEWGVSTWFPEAAYAV